ncbi:MAG: sigma 54-interacting transcriptional regulator [Ignavibacteriales bacterium]|nr:sigma 54-interacting transcriptional regulator [Ignavibacteriales bacterium]
MKKSFQDIKELKNLTKEQYEALYNLSQTLNSSSQEKSFIENVIDILVDVTNAERGLFAKYDHETAKFSIVSARNVKRQNISDLSNFSSSVMQQVVNKSKPVLYHDVQSNPKLTQFESVQLHNIKSILGVPVKREDKIWGVILVDSQKDRKEFTDKNLLFLQFFSNLVSISFEKIFEIENLADENIRLKNVLESVEKIPDMVGESKPMRELSKTIHRVANTEATVLILGESGSGKDLVARAIHKLSTRKDKPYLAQFCGSIPDSLLESELFGYVKGAFTGAAKDKKGLFEIADKGTFFLDEIADISSALQAKLLRVIENKEIIRLGDTQVKKVDVRILAATNKNLKKLVEEGKFREDLFYRLNVFPIKVPSLRERKDDIHLLAQNFVEVTGDKNLKLHVSAVKKLENYAWPGNVRQLNNVISRSIILSSDGIIKDEHIALEDEKSDNDSQKTLRELEKKILLERLEEFQGNKTLTAKSLDVSVRWIQKKLKEFESES